MQAKIEDISFDKEDSLLFTYRDDLLLKAKVMLQWGAYLLCGSQHQNMRPLHELVFELDCCSVSDDFSGALHYSR